MWCCSLSAAVCLAVIVVVTCAEAGSLCGAVH